MTAGVYQKFPCALPGAEKSKGALSEFWDRAHLYTTPPGIVFSCRSGKLQAGQNRESGFSRFAGNSKPVQVCPACEVVNRVAGSYPQVDTPGETGQRRRRKSKSLYCTHEKRAEAGLKCFRVDLYRYGHKKPNLAKIQSVDKGIKKSRLQRTARADGEGLFI